MKEIAANINRFSGSGLRQYEALAVDGRKTLEQFNQAVRSLRTTRSNSCSGSRRKFRNIPAPLTLPQRDRATPALTLKQAFAAISGSPAHALQENSRCGNAPIALEPSWSCAPFTRMDFEMGYFVLFRAVILDGSVSRPAAAFYRSCSPDYRFLAPGLFIRAGGHLRSHSGRRSLPRAAATASPPFFCRTRPCPSTWTGLSCAPIRNPSLIFPAHNGRINCRHLFRAGSSRAFKTPIFCARLADPARGFQSPNQHSAFRLDARGARQSPKSRPKSLVEADASSGAGFCRQCCGAVSDPAAVASAFDAALAEVMREIVIWTAPKI